MNFYHLYNKRILCNRLKVAQASNAIGYIAGFCGFAPVVVTYFQA